MKIACWSGPRNISTALMRSWSSRSDTIVSDEPLYAHYLKETGLNHPLREEIINTYETNYHLITKSLTSDIPDGGKIWYQKHMAHHLLSEKDLSWITNFQNCILIRHPKFVINSYIKKNILTSLTDLGYPQQLSIIKFLKKEKLKFHVIDSEDFLKNPEKKINDWCNFLEIDFQQSMLSWPKGEHPNDGIWGKHWYNNVNNSTKFFKLKNNISQDYKKFHNIYIEAKNIYKKIYNIIN